MTTQAERMWVNQPSKSQPLHHLHGTNVLAVKEGNAMCIYFLSGPVISRQCMSLFLSKGWVEEIPKFLEPDSLGG